MPAKRTPLAPRPRGRPSSYQPEYCQALIDHMSQGLSFESFAGAIKVARSTLYEWQKHYPEFAEAYKIGIPACELALIKLGYEIARGQITHTFKKTFMVNGMPIEAEVVEAAKTNAAAWVFLTKNICGWRDKRDVTVGGSNEHGPIKLTTESVEEKKKRLDELRQARLQLEQSEKKP